MMDPQQFAQQLLALKQRERIAREQKLAREEQKKQTELLRQQSGGSGVGSAGANPQLSDLTNEVDRLRKTLLARPKIPADKGGPCVTCGTPVSFNAQTCPNCHEPDVGNQVRKKKAAEEAKIAAEEAKIAAEVERITKIHQINLAEAERVAEAESVLEATYDQIECPIEKAIRKAVGKPAGKLTKALLARVTWLDLNGKQLTYLNGLETLTQLRGLCLRRNPDLTRVQIAEIQKALPKCAIYHNVTK